MLFTGIELGRNYSNHTTDRVNLNNDNTSLSTYLRTRQLVGNMTARGSRSGRGNTATDPSSLLHKATDIIPTLVARQMPPLLNEYEFETRNYDKIFASVWLSPTSIVMGTKCNKVTWQRLNPLASRARYTHWKTHRDTLLIIQRRQSFSYC